MSRSARRSLLRLLGRGYEVQTPPCLHPEICPGVRNTLDAPEPIPECGVTRWELTDVSLKAGWYMLEIEHSLASIGCVLTLDMANGRPEHLLLTSKAVCKRIIRLEAPARRLMVVIDQAGCTLKRFALVAMSERFVVSRLRKRLENRGSSQLNPEMNASALYDAYSRQIDDSVWPRSYRPTPWSKDINAKQASVSDHLIQQTRLILHPGGIDRQSTMDESVNTAMAFAQSLGWNVVWGEVSILDFDSGCTTSGTRVFHMSVVSEAVYRQDVFHQLLSSIDDQSVLIYADHDHIDLQGKYIDPVLKPEWNPELLLNADYIQLPWIVSDSWVRRLAGRSSIRESDADQLLLAASLGAEKTSPLTDQQVKRVPTVLASIKSGQLTICDDESRINKSWQEKISEALSGAGKSAAVVQGPVKGICRVVWALPETLPMVDIIIPTRDQVEVLKACIDSIFEKTQFKNYRLLVVDNDSKEAETHEYYKELQADSRVKLLHYAGDFNYSAINNYAVANSEAPLVVLLNNDTEVISPGWLEELAGQALRDEIGCVGAKLYYSNGRIQHGGVVVGINGVAGHAHRYCTGDARGYCDRLVSTQNLTAVTAACLAIRRSTYLEVGGLDQKHLGVAWNDVDLCLKVQQLGFRNLWTPYAELFHHEGLSRGADDTPAKMLRVNTERQVMIGRWKLDSFNDPAYHPLLTRESEQFTLGRTIT